MFNRFERKVIIYDKFYNDENRNYHQKPHYVLIKGIIKVSKKLVKLYNKDQYASLRDNANITSQVHAVLNLTNT